MIESPPLFFGVTFDRNQSATPFARRARLEPMPKGIGRSGACHWPAPCAQLHLDQTARRETAENEQAAAAFSLPRHGARDALSVRRADAQRHGRWAARRSLPITTLIWFVTSSTPRSRRGPARAPPPISAVASARRSATSPPAPAPGSSARSPARMPNSRRRSISPAAWSTSCAASPIPTATRRRPGARLLRAAARHHPRARVRGPDAGGARRGGRGDPLQVALPRRREPRSAPAAARDDAVRQRAVAPPRRGRERPNWSATSTVRCARSGR